MDRYICVTCGTRYPAAETPPAACPICEDDRQYVGREGQQWTTLDELRKTHRNTFRELATGITSILTEPGFGIGQQAHVVQTPQGNVLWDCIALIDDETISTVQSLGGLRAIAMSHPHYYTTILEWSEAFGGIPIYIHEDDREWVMEPGDAINFWDGETLEILPGSGLTLIRCGGHFPGAAVLHWSQALDGKGALFCGDTIQVVADQRWVSFMYSYPNVIPLNAAEIRRIVASVEPFHFRRIYGAFGGVVAEDGNGAVRRSAERYIKAIGAV
jgi:glyoxylase-like metal-dependent hydrolase (beta-lactamase superfamily II)